jgi:hypothetical protein
MYPNFSSISKEDQDACILSGLLWIHTGIHPRYTAASHVVRTAYFWEWDGLGPLGRLAKFRISRIQDSGQCTVRNIQIGI